jgi:hypothetical protein
MAARGKSPPEPRTIDIADLHAARSTLTGDRATDPVQKAPSGVYNFGIVPSLNSPLGVV